MRKLLIAAAVVLAFGAASVIFIATSTPPTTAVRPAGPPPAEAPAPAPAESPPAPAQPPPVAEQQPPAAPAQPPPLPPALAEAQPPPQVPVAPGEPPAWESITPAPSGWPALMAQISKVPPRSEECREQLAQARNRRPNLRARRSPEGAPDGGTPTVLILELDVSPGQVRIVGAPVETRGATPDAVVSCVQSSLAGQSLQVPLTPPETQRMKVRFPLR